MASLHESDGAFGGHRGPILWRDFALQRPTWCFCCTIAKVACSSPAYLPQVSRATQNLNSFPFITSFLQQIKCSSGSRDCCNNFLGCPWILCRAYSYTMFHVLSLELSFKNFCIINSGSTSCVWHLLIVSISVWYVAVELGKPVDWKWRTRRLCKMVTTRRTPWAHWRWS